MANGCTDPEDAAQHIDALLTQIEDINVKIKEVNGESWWIQTSRANDASGWQPQEQQICRFGLNCNKKDTCTRKHVQNPKGKGGKGGKDKKGQGKGKSERKGWQGKGDTSYTGRPCCDRQGCSNEHSQYGSLCKQCFDTAKTEGSYLNSGGKRVQVKSKAGKETKKAKKAEANFAKRVEEEVKTRMANNAQAVNESLTLDDPAPEHKVYIPISDYQRFMDFQNAANKVITPESDRTDNASVIGNAVDMIVRGPKSHKDRVKLKFIDESTLDDSLPKILDKIKLEYDNK